MNLSNLNHKDIWIRAGKTFVAAFIPIFIAGLSNLQRVFVTNGLTGARAAALGLVVAAFSAAITAVWNYALQISSTPSKTPPPV